MQGLDNNTDNIFALLAIGMAGMFLLATAVVVFYVRNQRKMIQHQKDLTRAVIQSQEAERKRIGTDLHDDVGSALSHLRLQTASVDMREKVDDIIQKVRSISHLLSPAQVELFGLESALEELCLATHQSGALEVTFDNRAELGSLTFEQSLSLYRVIQELFTNTLRHAEAARIDLELYGEGARIVCRYKDDGVGLPPTFKEGMGLYNIESRLGMIGATFHFREATEKGFGITIKI